MSEWDEFPVVGTAAPAAGGADPWAEFPAVSPAASAPAPVKAQAAGEWAEFPVAPEAPAVPPHVAAATAEIARVPGLNPAGRQAVMQKHIAAAVPESPQSLTPSPGPLSGIGEPADSWRRVPGVPEMTAGASETLGNLPGRIVSGFARAGAGLRDMYHNHPAFNAGMVGSYGLPANPGPTPSADAMRQFAADTESTMRPPGTPGAKVIDVLGQGTANVLPALAAGAVGGPYAAAAVGGAQLGGASYERVYERTGDVNRATMAGSGGAAIGALTGGIVGQNPVAKGFIGKAVEQTAEGVAYGGIQAGADEAIYSAATGDKPDWSRVPTEAGIGGAISFGLSALTSIATRGKARVRPEQQQQFEQRIRQAQNPSEVQQAIDEAITAFEGVPGSEPTSQQPSPPAARADTPVGPGKPNPDTVDAEAASYAQENLDARDMPPRVSDQPTATPQPAPAPAEARPSVPGQSESPAQQPPQATPISPRSALPRGQDQGSQLPSTPAYTQDTARVAPQSPGKYTAPQETIDKPAIFVSGKLYTGETHGEAMNKAMDAGDLSRDEDGYLVDRDGSDVARTGQIDLFTTTTGRVISRSESSSKFGIPASEYMPKGRNEIPPPPPGFVLDQPAQTKSPTPSDSTGGSALKDQSTPGVSVARADESLTATATVVKQKTARPARTPFSKAAIERRLVGYHEETGASFTPADDAEFNNISSGSAVTFFEKLPGEVKRHIENNPAARRLFRVTGDRTKSGGEDALHQLGDRYWEIIDKLAGNDLKAAKETIRKSGDPKMHFWAAVHDNLPPAKERPAQVGVDPATLNVGQEFELNGSKFQVVEDEDGYRILKDGNDYPEVPIDALGGEKIPVDKGSLTTAKEPELPDGDPFEDVPGNKTGALFHEPVAAKPVETERIRASSTAVDPSNKAKLFDSALPPKPAVDTIPGDAAPQTPAATPDPAKLEKELAATAEPAPAAKVGADEAVAPPPPDGLLDRAESWARESLKKLDAGTAEKMKGLNAAQRRQRGSAGSLDPQRLLLHAVIGAAKVGKGIKKYKDWTVSMMEDIGEGFASLPTRIRSVIYRDSRRLAAMDDKSRAEHIAGRFTVPQAESTKTTVRRLTGQVNTARASAEVQALTVKMKALARGSREGYRTAVKNLSDIKDALTTTIQATLPPEIQGRFLGDVANVKTHAGMRLALSKASNLLADYELRQAFNSVADLVGKRQIELPRPKKIRTPEITEAEAAERLGEKMVERLRKKETGEDIRRVDLTTLPEPHRTEVRKFISEAAAFRSRMRDLLEKGGTIEEKAEVVDGFERVEQEIRQRVADVENTREIEVGGKIRQRDELVDEIVKKIDPQGEAAADKSITSDPPRDASILRQLVRGHANMETIGVALFGRDSDAYRVAVEKVRRGQESYHNERRDFHRHMDKAFEAAGVPAKSKKLNDWINNREEVDLPDAGKTKITRNELAGIAAAAGDPQTASLIERGVGWTFRNNPRANPFKLTPRDVEAINDLLTPGERGLVDAFKKYNSEQVTARAMAAKIELSGFAPDPHEGYYPRARNRKQLEDAGLPEGWQGVRRRVLENISSMKERAPDLATPLYVAEFVQDSQRYIEDAARLMHLAEPVRSVAAVFEHPKVTQAIQKKLGEGMNTRIRNYLEESMQVRVGPPNDHIGRIAEAGTRNISRSALQLNPSPMVKNIFGGTISLLPEFDMQDIGPALAKAFSAESYNEMLDSSGVAWDRYEGNGLYGQYSPLTEKRTETLAQMTFTEAVKAKKPLAAVDAITLMRKADSVPFRVAWEASKNAIERTMPDAAPAAKKAAALAKFHDAVYATQNGNSSTEITGAGSLAKRGGLGNLIVRGALLFKSDALKKANMLMRLPHETPQKRAKILLAVGLNALLSSLIGYGLKKGVDAAGRVIGGTPDDDELEAKMQKDALWDLVSNVAGMSYVGDLLLDILRARHGSDALQNPVSEAANNIINDLRNLWGKAEKVAETDGEAPEWTAKMKSAAKAAERSLMSVNTLAGNPLVPVYRMGKRGYSAATYEMEDPRLKQNRDAEKTEAERTKTMRRDAGVDKLFAERAELDRKGGKGDAMLSPAERSRKHYLDGAARVFDRHREAMSGPHSSKWMDRAKRITKSAIDNPGRMEFERELTELRRNKDRHDELRRKGDRAGASTVFKPSEAGRLRTLNRRDEDIQKQEKKALEGDITVDELEKRVGFMLKHTMRKAG